MEYQQAQDDLTGDHQIRLYPNPVLREVSEPVEDWEFGPELQTLGQQMIALNRRHNGHGLAAPQIGLLKRLFVMEFNSPDHDPTEPEIICNPTLECYPEGTFENEGCLSMPGVAEMVHRATEVHMHYQTVTGEAREMVLLGIEARVVQHETDHLDGILFIDRMAREPRKRVIRAFEKQQPRRRVA